MATAQNGFYKQEMTDEEYALNTPYAKKHLENLVETKREKAAAAGRNEATELVD